MSIIVNNITKKYGSQKALDSVSLEIKPGEVVGLLGPNGAGKSTLMKILTCYIPPTSGDATVCGFDIVDQSIEVRKKIGYLPENNPLYHDLYVVEFLEFMAGTRNPVRAGNRKRIGEIIDLTGLEAEQHKKIGALSRGYRQRVGIAQALLHDPEVLILDEPTSGLDPNQLAEIRSLIKSIGEEKTVMLSTHIMQEVEAICDRTIIIHNGKIVADDLTKNIREVISSQIVITVEFGSKVEANLLKTIPGVLKVLNPLSGNLYDLRHREQITKSTVSNIWQLVSDSANDIRADVFQFAVDHHLTVLSLHREEQKLEDVFRKLTGVVTL